MSLLRRVDSGELRPDALVVFYAGKGEGQNGVHVDFVTATPDVLTVHGLVALGADMMRRSWAED